MMGIKTYQEKMFYNFKLSDKVPADHFLRAVNDVVDLRFVRELVADKYSNTGQRSIDPEVLFRMMLIGYFYGITSERRLAQDISVNIAYMWYLGYDIDEPTPHHSVISKARARFGKDVFEQFFNKILDQCVKAGLVRGEKVFADSTYIRADAAMKSLVARDSLEPPLQSKEFVEKIFNENPVQDDEPKAAQQIPNSSTTDQEHAKPVPKGVSNKFNISTTDPDSAVICHGKKLPLQLAYKEHFTVDSHARVITAVEVTNAAVGDEVKLPSLVERQPVPIKELCADTKYGTFDNYAFLLKRGILPSIPCWEGGNPSKEKRFYHTQFAYDAETDRYTCPAGCHLTRGNDQIQRDRLTYRAKKRDCRHCAMKAQCIGSKMAYRKLFRHVLHNFKDIAMKHLATDHAKETLRQRKVFAEWINAESKTRHGLRRAMFRGLWKVTIQVLLTASVQNIKRLVSSRMKSSGFYPFKELSYFFLDFAII
jgi:transposase